MTEPQRVDWTIEDAPSCADCVHSWWERPDIPLCRINKFLLCRVPQNDIGMDFPNMAWCTSQRRDGDGKEKPLCGASARYFERKPREHGNYDFENDPPIAMGWV
jgi:hypothetical protein